MLKIISNVFFVYSRYTLALYKEVVWEGLSSNELHCGESVVRPVRPARQGVRQTCRCYYNTHDRLNEEFDKCIGDRGEFGGNFEQFRRRHQAISRSVQEADRFLTFSNAAGFCSLIISIILVLYCSLFTRGYTFSLTTDGAVLYFFWLAANLFGISLAVGLAIFVNRKVSKVPYSRLYIFTYIQNRHRNAVHFPPPVSILPQRPSSVSHALIPAEADCGHPNTGASIIVRTITKLEHRVFFCCRTSHIGAVLSVGDQL